MRNILCIKRVTAGRTLILATRALSTIFGFYYMYNLGVNDGLFKLWI